MYACIEHVWVYACFESVWVYACFEHVWMYACFACMWVFMRKLKADIRYCPPWRSHFHFTQ